VKNKKKPDDSWFGFFRDNPIYGAIVVILVLAALSSAPFEPGICTADEQNPCKYVVRYHLIHWLFAFVDKYSGGIGAITAIVIAAFTYTLKNASIEQGRLTERSVRAAERALTEIERPWLFIFIEHGTEEDNDPGFVKSATIHFRMANYGKAPAIIISAAVGAGATLTPETSLRDDLSNEVIAPAGESRFSHTFTSETGFFHDKDACIPQNTFLIPVKNEGASFFFCTDITYTGVSPDTCYKTACCWYWDEWGTGWLRYEQPGYNYRT